MVDITPEERRALIAWRFKIPLANVTDAQVDDFKNHERYFIYRHRAGLTQSEIARRMGVSPSQISAEERGVVSPRILKDFWGV